MFVSRNTIRKGAVRQQNRAHNLQRRRLSSPSNLSRNTIRNVTKRDRLFEVEWGDSHVSRFHNVWLRDHCLCKSCVEPSSGQKLRTRADLPNPLELTHFTSDEKSIEIKWSDGHVTKFTADWLREHCYSKSSLEERYNRKQPFLWDRPTLEKNGGVPRFDYQAVMNDDRELYKWLQSLNKFGLALVSNVPTQEGTIKTVAERISYLRNTMYGLVWDVISVPNPINVAYTSVELPPHQDLCYYEAPPGIQLLHCLRFDMPTGGDSTFIDGFWAATELKRKHPESFNILSTLHTEYFKYDRKNMMRYSRPIIVTDKRGEIMGLNYSPNFEAPLRVEEEFVEQFYAAYKDFANILSTTDCVVKMRLRPGDLVSFNNRRIFHARTAFDETQGVRHLQGVYIDLDEFSNKYRLLERQFGETNDSFARSGNWSH